MADSLFGDILYNHILVSDGYDVEYAVCTTYSLDMPTLLSVPFMLGTMGGLSTDAMPSPHYILESISRSAGKFAVFFNAGCISVPQNLKTNIYSLLERSLVQISLGERGKGFVNFHPKVWVVLEKNRTTAEEQMKVVVMSRNLTGSTDIDIVCELTGKVETSKASESSLAKHQPLIDFLSWLSKRADHQIKDHIDKVCHCIECVEKFDLGDSPFGDYDFFPIGIDGYEKKAFETMTEHSSDALIISPFVDEDTLRKLTKPQSKSYRQSLITRYSSITENVLSLFNDGVYAVKETLTDKNEKDVAVDIHEKLYFIHNSSNLYNYLYIGSANATKNAFGRNVEFLLRLRFIPHKTSYDKFKAQLINEKDKECLFEKVNGLPENINEKEDVHDELALRKAIAFIQQAHIKRTTDDHYDVTIDCKRNTRELSASIYPLYCPAMGQTLDDGIKFQGLELKMLSEFYVLTVGQERSIIKIRTLGMPWKDRDKAVFQSVVNTKAKFIDYISFLLTDSPEVYLAEANEKQLLSNANGTMNDESVISTSLYEDMVRTAYQDPDRLNGIEKLMENADEKVIPDGFNEMFRQFKNAVKKIKRL